MTAALLEKALTTLSGYIHEAEKSGVRDPASATLATSTTTGQPSVRTVFVHVAKSEGLIVFADLSSGKGRQMLENPHAAVCMFWPSLQYQAVIEGTVEVLAESISDQHWKTRSRESRLAALVSDPGDMPQPVGLLREKLVETKKTYSFEHPPRPERWRAFLIRPVRIELWQTGWHRLSRRIRYQQQASGEWIEEAVNP